MRISDWSSDVCSSDVVHYCVTNMPGAVARTSTFALNNATLPFVLALANDGYRRALTKDRNLRNGLNVHEGRVTYRAVAAAPGLTYTPAEEALGLYPVRQPHSRRPSTVRRSG